ncbi:MAG: DUF748 domain-containing protein [Nitrospira sp.]
MAQAIRVPRWLKWTGTIIGVLIVLSLIAAALMDEPIRRYVEKTANGNLKGYTLRIGKLDLHPLTLSLDVENATFIQNRNPEPPMLQVPKWHASLQWSQLLKGSLVSDHVIERPAVYVTRPQAKSELRDSRRSVWQDEIRKIFPLRINQLVVKDAEVTYFDHPKARPLELTEVQFEAGNISNRDPEGDYPSTMSVDAKLFKDGHVKADGTANFLAKPFLGINVDFALDRVPVEDLIGVTGRYNVLLKGGVLATSGRAEYSPWKQVADIRDLLLEDVKADYVYRRNPKDEKHRAEAAGAAKEVKEKTILVVAVKHGKILHSEFGFVNKSAKPDYRVFVADVNAELDHFTTRLQDLQGGDSVVKVTGKFMGTGRSVIAGTFRPEKPNPDFDLGVQIVKTELKSFNNVLRAYADMDLAKGNLSFFSELSIKNGQVEGYVKPIFKDVEVYDPAQDSDKAWTKKVYEAVIGGVVELLKNEPRQQVAAETEVTGPLPSPRADTWQIVGTLIQNAFFKAILPGLEREHGKA